MDTTSTFAPITKTAPQEDGSLLVYGKATGSDLDLDGQRCDPVWLQNAMPAFMVIGNVREQHDSKRAVGKAFEHEVKDDGHYIRARIVDPVAVAKTKAGIFTGFSIGVSGHHVSKSADAPNGVIDAGSIVEISLVDRPALPTATLTVCKRAKPGMQIKSSDFDSERLLVRCEEYIEKAVKPDMQKSGEMTVTLADQLSPEQVEALAEKATDVDHLEAPAPGQVCADCNEDGHLNCGPTDKAAAVEVPAEDVEKAVDIEVEVPVGFEPAADINYFEPEFDVAQAKALVAAIAGKEGVEAAKAAGEILGKADASDVPPQYSDEQSDVLNAQAAIAIIGKLIVSEASELVNNPAEACDIQILLQAVSALRCFIGREQQQSLGENEVGTDDSLQMAAEADVEKAEVVEKAKYSADELRQMLADGKAMKNPDGNPSYPIGDVEDLENAIHAVGRGKGDHNAIRTYIKGRAKALGKSDLIPDDWSNSSKAADSKETDVTNPVEPAVEATKTVEPDTAKAVGAFDEDTLLKALTGALEKGDSPLGGLLIKALIAASTEDDAPLKELIKSVAVESTTVLVEASTKSAAEATSELVARLEKVESMATPGGPALRRTEIETKTAQKSELLRQADHWRAKSLNVGDADLRRGWAARAAELEAKAELFSA
jgi:hypothetical protein